MCRFLRYFILYVSALASLAGCAAGPAEMVVRDVAYGSDSLQTMDMSLVEGRDASTPLIILVHGGGWMAGDKKDAEFMRDACFAKGINVVNINYRMGEGIHYEEMMADLDMAVEYLYENAGRLHIRTSKMVMWGGSAGAHLALLYAYGYDVRNAISLVMTLGAPTKLDSFGSMRGAKPQDVEGLLPVVTGKPWTYDEGQLDEAYHLASPYYAKNLKPTLLVHGEKDDIVPLAQSEVMSRKLKENGVADTLIVLPGAGHGGENCPPDVSRSLDRTMYEWIVEYSK